jgi:hypothetical protein
MLFKNLLLVDNKLVMHTFVIQKNNNEFIIDLTNLFKENIKVPIYNKYSGIIYEPIIFPFKIQLHNNIGLCIYNVFFLFSMNIQNDLNFFYNLEQTIQKGYNINIFKYTNKFNKLNNNDIELYLCNNPIILKYNTFDELIKKSIINLNLVKLYTTYCLTFDITILPKSYLSYIYGKINKKFNIKKNYNESIDKLEYIYNIYTDKNINSYIFTLLMYNDNGNLLYEYYYKNLEISNILSLYKNFYKKDDFTIDMMILKENSYDSIFFKEITKKYSNNKLHIITILNILFNLYSYPLKSSRHDIDPIFDYILYFSLHNYYILLNMNILDNIINKIITIKIKGLYLSLLKMLYGIINNNFDVLKYTHKYYTDYLYKTTIKIFMTNSNSITVKYLKENIKEQTYNEFKNILKTKMSLIDISTKLTWNNISNKLNYLEFYYKNSKYGVNTHMIQDYRIKKILENAFNMYKYLKSEKDFIKWSHFISNNLINIYYIPKSLSSLDIKNIGKFI